MPPLEALIAAGHEVLLVVTGPDRRRGRGGSTSPSPVKAAALELDLPVTDRLDAACEVDAALGVVVAYGRILPADFVAVRPYVNLHFSLLPRWRGAAPVEWAILEGDERTGVCVMAVEEGLDTGGVYARAETDVDAKTLDGLRAELVDKGSELLLGLLAAADDGSGGVALPEPAVQEGEATYARKITAEDRRLRWERPAVELDRVVRVGGATTSVEGRRLKVLSAALDPVPGSVAVPTGAGRLHLVEVQPEGKRPMSAADWLRGLRRSDPPPLGT